MNVDVEAASDVIWTNSNTSADHTHSSISRVIPLEIQRLGLPPVWAPGNQPHTRELHHHLSRRLAALGPGVCVTM